MKRTIFALTLALIFFPVFLSAQTNTFRLKDKPDVSNPDTQYIYMDGSEGVKRWLGSSIASWLGMETAVKTEAQFVAAISSSATSTIKVIAPFALTSNRTVTRPLAIQPGCPITTTGYTLTINGPFSAGPYRVFSGTGTVTFGAATSVIDPPWWYDGGGNWAAAINAAIQSASAGQFIDLPTGTLTLKGTGTELILLNHALKMRGKGPNATILSLSVGNVGATTDVIRLAPNMSYGWGGGGLGFELSDFTITPSDGATPTGRYGIVLDTSASASIIAAESKIEKVWIYPTLGASIYQQSFTGSGTNPGWFNGVIRDCMLWNGLTATNFGDTNRIEDNFFRGDGYGVNITMFPGTSSLKFTGNVSTAAKGCVFTNVSGSQPSTGNIIIDSNQFEGQIPNTGSDLALLTVKGATGNPIPSVTITNNKFYDSYNDGTGGHPTADYLHIANLIMPKVGQNSFAVQTPSAQKAIVLSNTVKGADLRDCTYIDSTFGPTYYLSREMATNTGGYSVVSDSGIGTIGLPKVISLLNSWVAYAVTPTMKKIEQDTVSINGMIASGTVTDGTELFVLPVGYRPEGNISKIVPASISSGYGLVELRFTASSGSVKLYGASAMTVAYIELNGVTFKSDMNY